MRKNFLTLVAAALALSGSSRNKMKVTFGDLITAGSGSAGGHTYSRNKGGAYRKNKAIPLQPRSSKQVAVRLALSSLSQSWRTLSSATLNSWNAAAKTINLINSLGRSYQPTGINYYIALNALITQINNLIGVGTLGAISTPIPLINLPPSFFAPSTLSLSNFNFTATGVVGFDIASDFTGSGNIYAQVYASAPISPGISNPGSVFKLITFLALSSGTNSLDIGSAYSNVYGVPTVGSRIFLNISPINPTTGQQGLPVPADAIVTP